MDDIGQNIGKLLGCAPTTASVRDRVLGSLMGGAAGDALGYPVEFMSLESIKKKFGPAGINGYDTKKEGVAVFSDDTQMTLFTATGLLYGETRKLTHDTLTSLDRYVAYAYRDWLQTQTGVDDYRKFHYSWIRDIKELNVLRAPGNTCLSALEEMTHHRKVDNYSKGCGGVMRVAPVGLLAAADQLRLEEGGTPQRRWTLSEVVRLGGDCASITHKHPLGYLPAAFLAGLVYSIITAPAPVNADGLEGLLGSVHQAVREAFNRKAEQSALGELWLLLTRAVSLAWDTKFPDTYCISLLGEGWTGDEALAISLFCALRHPGDFRGAVVSAVNHDGDSDSTGAICGNIMGAVVGYEGIPEEFLDKLEMKDLLAELADDLVAGCPASWFRLPDTEEGRRWKVKYVINEPLEGSSYHIMAPALKEMRLRRIMGSIRADSSQEKRCRVGYDLALAVYDTEDFDPARPISGDAQFDEPKCFGAMLEDLPVCSVYRDPKYAPHKLVFRLNLSCFDEGLPIIACRTSSPNSLIRLAGLTNAFLLPGAGPLNAKYPGWKFLKLRGTITDDGYAVLASELEEGFTVELAHLHKDGSLHRFFYLCR